jgi:thiol-disulfide isomerase/thioredoxin
MRCVVAVLLWCGMAQHPLRGSDALEGVVALNGEGVAELPIEEKGALVLIFTSVECPIANRYAPTLRKMVEEFKGARFILVYSNPDEKAEAISKHLREYDLPMTAWQDSKQALARKVGATVTPEAAVYLGNGELVYRGRIDDRYVDWNQRRPAATKHDLKEVLGEIAAGKKVEARRTTAVGCHIAAVDR